jgi:hypothetical protein
MPAHGTGEIWRSETGLAVVGELVGQHQHAAGVETKSPICCLSAAAKPLSANAG